LQFHVTAPGTVNAISYYQAAGEPIAPHAVSLTDISTSVSVCGGPCGVIVPSGAGFFASTFAPRPVVVGDTYVASYSEVTHFGYNDSIGPSPFPATQGTLVGEKGVYSSPAGTFSFATVGNDYGVNVQFFQQPNPNPVTATRLDSTHASIAFGDSGDAGTTYTISCTSTAPGSVPFVIGPTAGLTSPQTVTLTPGDMYTCTVTATSTGGTGTGSAQASVLIVSGPGCAATTGSVTAPVVLSSAPGEKLAVVSWKQGVADPPSCYVGSLITPNVGGTAQTQIFLPGHGSTIVIRGLTDGTTYTFTVAVVTGSGVGPQSAPTGPLTVGAPAAVTHLKAANAGKGAIKVSFKGWNNNGAAITKFTATCGSQSASGTGSPLTVKGLTAGKSYTCTVTATNSRGTGQGATSNAVKA